MKNILNAIRSFIAVFCVSVVCTMTVFAESQVTGADNSQDVAAVILFTNDVHCAYEENSFFLKQSKTKMEKRLLHCKPGRNLRA